jgi:hypothetical protein
MTSTKLETNKWYVQKHDFGRNLYLVRKPVEEIFRTLLIDIDRDGFSISDVNLSKDLTVLDPLHKLEPAEVLILLAKKFELKRPIVGQRGKNIYFKMIDSLIMSGDTKDENGEVIYDKVSGICSLKGYLIHRTPEEYRGEPDYD